MRPFDHLKAQDSNNRFTIDGLLKLQIEECCCSGIGFHLFFREEMDI